MSDYRTIEELIRNSYMGVVWTHKIHEKQADIYSCRRKIMGTINLIASSLTSAGLISLVFASDELWLKLATAIVSFVTLSTEAVSKTFDTQAEVEAHKKTAVQLLELRDKYQHLLMKLKIGTSSIQEIDSEYEKLERKKHNVYKDAPRTTDKSVKKAANALNVKHDNTFSDDEIDATLPVSLRKDR